MNRAIGAVEAVPDRKRVADDKVKAAFLKFLRAKVGEDAVRLLMVKMEDELSQRDLIRDPEFVGLGEWGIRRLMARNRDPAVKFAERQGDDAILAAINRLTRTDEWCGGRGWPHRRVCEGVPQEKKGRRGESTRHGQESLRKFLLFDFRDLEDVAQVLQQAERGQ
jgi:hypothetical protein